ncbi:chorismate lyase [Gallaecimonas kandeliae]|uniref:chorismate--pyruvate lyase family protein n=1 Tax=Gallaecimonas kandeliae TaxID=3029055 RepID=UPI00264774B1|nr:chorismate lyase [Gallaecimonas kandeliae]WKE65829.1 chorismate lyase [Gallaecimonas kandeliae]
MWSDWQWMSASEAGDLTPEQRQWLLAEGSMTRRLKGRCEQFRVQLLGLDSVQLGESQRRWLGLEDDVTERTVLLLADGVPCVYAKSLWAGQQHPFANLGEQPLGEQLFVGGNWRRGPIRLARVKDPLPGLALPTQDLWARCSAFEAQAQGPVWVMEVLLPAIYQLDTL